jgi:maltooligosyltrehalose trehalohydrolase
MSEVTVWAPTARRVRVSARSGGGDPAVSDLTATAGGWWRGQLPAGEPEYGFLLDDRQDLLPDPRSRRQPHGVHGPSQVYPADFAWSDEHWLGRPLAGAVIYEMHIGTFTPQGTFEGAAGKLDHLVALGVTHLELLPVNDFNGPWNWGYDGVLWYAVHETYGGPDGLKRFVDACHARGLAVLLDAVYNHLGPSGNYLPQFGPYLKSERNTWGDLLNLDAEGSGPVRRYIIDNALMWLGEFHLDGLRLDAVHALQDSSDTHLLAQLSSEVDALAAHVRRPLVLIAESDLNDPVMITSREAGGYGLDGQWDDDVHHALHSLISGETQGYYNDFGSLAAVAKVLTRAFYHDGTYSTFRGRLHGKPVDQNRTPGYRFVVTTQNHDQVGNRAAGDRMPEITSPGLLRIGALLLLTSPFTPMLWMGEEWAAETRWTFFTSHPEPELAAATGKGRIEEFSQHGWDVSQIIDPQDPAAFESSKLDWSELDADPHRHMFDFYRALISLRGRCPELSDPRLHLVTVDYDEDARWLSIHRGDLRVVANLSDSVLHVPLPAAANLMFVTAPGAELTESGVTLPAESGAVIRLA